MTPLNYKRLVIKIGSNVLARENGLPDETRMQHLIDEIARLKKQGMEVVVVSSGAVAAGKSLVRVSEKSDLVAARQLLASVGQVQLINQYAHFFKAHDLICSQVLVTKEDFRDRLHYGNMHSCFEILLQHNIIPIVNENDVISVTELMFTDNDELAGLIASMIRADGLLILTNVDGLFTGDPRQPGSKLVEEVGGEDTDFSAFITAQKSNFGRGGMLTKCHMARKIAQLGIAVHIANGTRLHIISELLAGKAPHTHFMPQKALPGRKRWMAHTDKYAKGIVQVNTGAREALTGAKASSLLPVGIVHIKGEFKKKDIIKIVDEQERLVGLGIAEYGSDKAQELIGKKNQKPLVHYDYLYLSHENY
jgi:glutamate 5-kinase